MGGEAGVKVFAALITSRFIKDSIADEAEPEGEVVAADGVEVGVDEGASIKFRFL